MAKRKYEMTRREQQQEETRQRIVDATIRLHSTIGGQAATISRIAEEAGVERLTVYRHFPDEHSLLLACTGHYLAQHPPPDPARWATISDPEACLRAALTDLYAFYRETDAIMFHAQLDMPVMPTLVEVMMPFFGYVNNVQALLAGKYAREGETQALIHAATGLAIDYNTWRSLIHGQGLDDAQAIEIMAVTVRCLAN